MKAFSLVRAGDLGIGFKRHWHGNISPSGGRGGLRSDDRYKNHKTSGGSRAGARAAFVHQPKAVGFCSVTARGPGD